MDQGMVLITSNGPHPADKWAEATAKRVFVVNEKTAPGNRIAANKVQIVIMEALEAHHEGNISAERSALQSAGDGRLSESIEPNPQAALNDVIAIVKASPWAHLADNPDWRQAVGNVIATDFATAADIERQWYCDRNKSSAATAYKDASHGGVN